MNKLTAGLALIPVGSALLILGLVYSESLGDLRYLLLVGAVVVLMFSLLLMLLHLGRG